MRLFLAIIGIAIAAMGLPGTSVAAEGAPPAAMRWLTAVEIAKRLDLPVSVSWSHTALRQSLRNLSQAQKLAIVLDRRIDPEQEINLSIDAQPLSDALKSIAADRKIGFSLLGPVAYFGPAPTAHKLRTLSAMRRAEAARLAKPAAAKLLAERAWRWDELATPRELVAELSRQAGVAVEGVEQIPHDLWPAADLPPLAWIDRLTLVAAQFDLTFEVADDGRSVRLLRVPEQVFIDRSYPGGERVPQLVADWSKRVPEAQVRADGHNVVVRGRVEDHEQIAAKPFGQSKPPLPTATKNLYTLSVKNARVRDLVRQLGTRLGLSIELDEPAIAAAGISLEKVVSLQVKDATLDQLLTAALSPAGLTHQRKGNSIQVVPAVKKRDVEH